MASRHGLNPTGSQSNTLMIACSETDANLYYASRFLAPDPFVYLRANGRSYLLMSDLELDRARALSNVDEVLSYSAYEDRIKKSGVSTPKFIDVVHLLMEDQGVEEWIVPGNFPLQHADALRFRGQTLQIKQDPFFEQRAIKTDEEVTAIREVQVGIEEALDDALDLLRNAEIKGNHLYFEGVLLTSESVRRRMDLHFMERGFLSQHTIISCGVDACDPHNEGSGPLRAHEAIIFDIFPRSIKNRYYADMSRTVVKGKAPDSLKKLYDTVLDGQMLGIEQVRNGAHGKAIHNAITALFEKRGYETGMVRGRMQGFFHGTGHGIGLDIHEPPRISKQDWVLKEGEVVTVEPGLYYPEIGAVRIEDMVLVEETGCRNLTTYPKELTL